MKLQLALLLLLVAVSVRARNVRDIGLHLQGDHAHEHHHHEEAAASSASAASKQGYGRDVPEPALPVTLTEPAAPKQSGYPRENPANPLKIDAQPANEVEVRVQPDQSNNNNNNMMMMGGEIPGTAGVDYPIYDTVPETSFKCEDQATGGYYADEEARCQVFHICHDKYKSSFLCPNGTLFQQKVFVCDWWFNVDCSTSKDFFNLNAQIGVVPEKAPETDAVVAASNAVDSPALDYLPPKEEPVVQEPVVQEPETSYLPPATAVEAIANGILGESAPAPPSQNYLPPQ